MNHFDALSEAADASLFMANVDLPRAEDSVHAFLDHYSSFDPKQLSAVLAGQDNASLGGLETMEDCLVNSDTKHLVKFGALAILTAVAWKYDPQAIEPSVINRNSSAAMSVLTGFVYSSHNRVADTAHAVGESIGVQSRDTSTEDIQMAILTYKPAATADRNHVSDSDTETDDDTSEIISIGDEALRNKVAEFPWIDTPAEDISLDARLERGLNDIDVLIVDLTPYSSKMQSILADATAHFDESMFRSMELSQIAKVLTGNQSGYVNPASFRDAELPNVYCAKSVGNNENLRRLYVSRIGVHEGKPVFARLGFSRTKANQSELSQILGFYPVKS